MEHFAIIALGVALALSTYGKVGTYGKTPLLRSYYLSNNGAHVPRDVVQLLYCMPRCPPTCETKSI